MKIPFNTPYYSGGEADYIKKAFENIQLSGDGYFTKYASTLLQGIFNSLCSSNTPAQQRY